MNHLNNLELPPEDEALLRGLYDSRESIDIELNNITPTAENRRKIYALQNQRKKVVDAINSILFSSDKEYADEEFGYYVFKHIINNPQIDKGKRDNIKEAMESARIACRKESEWVEEVRGNRYLFTKQNLKILASEGDLKLLMKFGTLKKRSIINTSSLNSAAGEFSDQKRMAEVLEDHSNRIKGLEKESGEQSKRLETHSAHLEVFSHLLGDQYPDWKETASRLKEKGFSQRAIADVVPVSLRTLKNWWNDL